jgi:hypothetical protein
MPSDPSVLFLLLLKMVSLTSSNVIGYSKVKLDSRVNLFELSYKLLSRNTKLSSTIPRSSL